MRAPPEPKAVLPLVRIVPALKATPPVKVLLPDSVRTDVALVSLTTEPAPEITPDRVWLALEL